MHIRKIILTALVLFTGCASTQPVIQEKKVDNGNHYLIYYNDNTGIHTLNTATNRHTLLLPHKGILEKRKISCGGGKIAVSCSEKDSSHLYIINTDNPETAHIQSVPSAYAFSFEWSADSKQIGVGYALRDKKKTKNNGGIYFYSADGKNKKSAGCRLSNIFRSFLTDEKVMVGFQNTLFVVNSGNCKTLHTIPGADMDDIVFSPDRQRFIYSEIEIDYEKNTDKAREIFALYISDHTGKKIKRLISSKYDPRNAQWSPGGEQLVCDIASQEIEGIRHIALYDLTEGKVNFFKGDIFYDTEPNCTHPLWSPSSSMLLYLRTYKKGNSLYEHIVVKDLFPEKHQIIASCETDITVKSGTTFIPTS
ncbi:hypothetical protein KAS50_07895, partial [bacterium]|nr:hypothetical protein [bacterium]